MHYHSYLAKKRNEENYRKKYFSTRQEEFWDVDRDQVMFAETKKRCSCGLGCGNHRRNPWLQGRERLTLQERKDLDKVKNDLYEEAA